ncbi:MAG: hypothetical protein PHP23_07755 [Desulfobacterales bacterium]|nr:hypothetical protein [Desulfobacterales bacterium]MDD4072511.1 hypothetical protein [Desulfobacterales bacterium]MDD4393712.1 hypothetical protein [Desulfobacterales bacterium]
MPVNNIKKLTEESLGQLFSNPGLFFLAQRYLNLIERLSQQIKMIEKQAMGTIITRFEKVGNYCSYCRCVSSERISNRENQILIP